MRTFNTFFREYYKFRIFGMLILPNRVNFTIDLTPGIRFSCDEYSYAITISWLIVSLEFNYTIKEQENNLNVKRNN